MILKMTAALFLTMALSLGAGPSATAGTPPSIGQVVHVKTGAYPAAFADCNYGYHAATVSTSLSNGIITSVFCRSSNRLLMQAKTRYAKSSGNAVTLRNFWEWTNSNGGTSVRRQVSAEYTIAPGNPDKISTWNYPSGLGAPDSSNRCNRGGVRVSADGATFTTRVTCAVTN